MASANVPVVRVRGVVDYKEKRNPIMVAGKHREETSLTPGEFFCPCSIAINSKTNNIYICDVWNNRVQVFNESLKFLFTFSDKMNLPIGICIHLNTVYVTQCGTNSLTVYSTEGRYLQSVGREGKKELEFQYPKGVAVSTVSNRIYICDANNLRIQCLNIDFSFNSFIPNILLHLPIDIKLTPQHIVVLTDASPCIHFYDYSHRLVREIITRGKYDQVINPLYFCLDREFNILLTDKSPDAVLILSDRGELLHKFGFTGELRGALISPAGIATDRKGRIIVVSLNPEHCIQMF